MTDELIPNAFFIPETEQRYARVVSYARGSGTVSFSVFHHGGTSTKTVGKDVSPGAWYDVVNEIAGFVEDSDGEDVDHEMVLNLLRETGWRAA